jgi:tRNA/tmRNA/rRNA uracil-C5-methylase (TrmA/RlmC/RlmD family)
MDSNNYIKPNDLKFYEDININDSFYDYLIKKKFFTEDELSRYYYKEDLKELNFYNHEWNGVNYLKAFKQKLFSDNTDNYRHRVNLRIWDCVYNLNSVVDYSKDIHLTLSILYFMKHYNIIRNNSGRICNDDNKNDEKGTIQSNLAYLNRIAIKKLYNYKLYTLQNKKIKELEQKIDNIYLMKRMQFILGSVILAAIWVYRN